MEQAELRRRVGDILAAEEGARPDWARVGALSAALNQYLRDNPGTECPESVSHYLDDDDIRARDERYGARQRERMRHYVETGEHAESVGIPWWGCLLVVGAIGGGVVWLLL